MIYVYDIDFMYMLNFNLMDEISIKVIMVYIIN